MSLIPHFIDGARFVGRGGRAGDVFDRNTGLVEGRVGFACRSDVAVAVAVALAAQTPWAASNPQRRARVMFAFRALLEREMDDLAFMLSCEHGKVLADSRGEIERGLEVIEFACGVPHLMKGDYSEAAGSAIDVYAMRQPLGVVAGITPFNFPAMIPMWMLGPAIAAGNAFILKPSERNPSVSLRLAELMIEAGLPVGVLNVVQGDGETVEAIIEHPDVKAVSFVGSSDIAQQVYSRGTAGGKRVQAMGGAKNHAIVLPDADIDRAVAEIVGAAFGSARERCMALPVAVPVGRDTADRLVDRLLPAIAALRVGISTDKGSDYGPVISAQHKMRIEKYIAMGVDEGASLLVDGRGFELQGHHRGYFIGPTLFDHVTPDMQSYRDEIFGPVLQIVRADTLAEATDLPSRHQFGNGVALFTANGHAARDFAAKVQVGMVGINVPIRVPVAYHSFGGWKRSAFGDTNQYGVEGLRFFTKVKTVTQRWPDAGASTSASLIIPTMA